MPFTLSDRGELIDAETKAPIQIDGQGVSVQGVVTQSVFDSKIAERMARADKDHKKVQQKLLSEYEEKLKGTINPEDAAKLRKTISDLEETTMDADALATKRVSAVNKEHETAMVIATETSERHLGMYQDECLRNAVYREAARCNFMDPADALQTVRPWAVWEEDRDDDGKTTGKWNLVFRTKIVVEEGKDPVEKTLTAEQAVGEVAKQKKYLLRGSNKGGYGERAADYGPLGKPDEMKNLSPRQKMALGYAQTG